MMYIVLLFLVVAACWTPQAVFKQYWFLGYMPEQLNMIHELECGN